MKRLMIFMLLVLVTAASTSFAYLVDTVQPTIPTVSLPQSGQTKCYDTTGAETTCAGTGQDGDKGMGVTWPNPRFSVSGNCVTDNLTGLMWSQNANLAGGKIWTGALDWVASMNSGGGLCGYTDWRLPSINELRSLMHSGYKQEICGGIPCYYLGDWLQSRGFANVQSNYYWSSTTSAYSYGTSYAWVVGLDVGYVLYGSETDSYSVWPVRGGSDAAAAPVFKTGQTTSYHAGDDGLLERGIAWPLPRFTVNGTTGTVTDNLTGLTWLKNANCFGSQAWANALNSANNLANGNCGLLDGSHAGDWRLPNREELESLVDFAYYGPGLSNSLGTGKWAAGDPFDNVQSFGYWSSSTYDFITSGAWIVHMHGGSAYDVSKVGSSYVWPVRGGTGAWASLPISERTTLLNLYRSTNGSSWTNNTNWNGGVGTECSWYGVTCDYYGNHVVSIQLSSNNLSGTLPDISNLTGLRYFNAGYNQLTGEIPSLSGLTNLLDVYVAHNQLTGAIPSLTGLTSLGWFGVDNNQLTGAIPSLSGLTSLVSFAVANNQLTGAIPSLSGLTSLQGFYAFNNQLTGTIPSLAGLTNLQWFNVSYNQLTGDAPAVPSPDNLFNGGSQLCPNYLNYTSDPAWDVATGSTPWYQNCTAPPATYSVTYDGNGNTGGSVPVDGSTYFSGQLVAVLRNTGALYKTGDSFVGWNTAANGSGMSYVGGDTFTMGSTNIVLYAQWTTASGLPVRIAETLAGYPDIQSAYGDVQNGQTIEAQDGLCGQNLLFDNPHNYNPFSVKLRGGYNATVPPFTTDIGATLVIGRIEISRGSIEIEKIIIQ